MKFSTVAIVGVGLIGGSLGLAVKQRGLANRVLGVGRHQKGLDLALARQAIDEGFLHLADAVAIAELVVFCTPVDGLAQQVLAAARHCAAGAILTDAGSTKSEIMCAIDGQLPAGVAFVGGHPLAGSEKRGPEYADANLFQDRLTLLTPTTQTSQDALDRVIALWQGVGSRVRLMTPQEHDRSLALTSHLPHLLASALAGILPVEWMELAASGFRDTTRIAAGDPSIWTGIFTQNRRAVLDALSVYCERLGEYRQALEAHDFHKLDQIWTQAKKVRDALGS